MNNEVKLMIYTEEILNVGQTTSIESEVENGNCVVFQDNGETGYFYAIDTINEELIVLDALHIYNVKDVVNTNDECLVKILWTEDKTKAILSINNYYHALLDFKNKQGYCRTGFPKASKVWQSQTNRQLTDALLDELFF
ncbi:MAG: DUF2251 domain-containing protein [Flavobacterium sp.]|jgi:hypothetical protein|uniref:DUF2251 domain-containing protein n=1 Tax=Flavobacterium sp. TaxID=239 RepID=UPI0035B43789